MLSGWGLGGGAGGGTMQCQSTELSATLQLAAHISGLHGQQRFCSTSQESSDKYYMASLTSYLIAFNLERTLFFCTFILPYIIVNRPDFAFDI